MPLLKKHAFVKKPIPQDLNDNEEVFYCSLTKEIFRNYDEFFERVIVCNSLVWTCSISGRCGLTYQEALESEQKSLKSLEEFPDALQKPLLYLVPLTHRATFNEMSDDIFGYVKDRFFIGEIVQVMLGVNKKTCQIIQVQPLLNSEESFKKRTIVKELDDTTTSTRNTPINSLHPNQFKYLVRECPSYPTPDDKNLQSQGSRKAFWVKPDNVQRMKSVFTRVKNKLFLKNHTMLDPKLKLRVVKPEFIKQYNLKAARFSDFFGDVPPQFNPQIPLPIELTNESPETRVFLDSVDNGLEHDYSSYMPMPQTKDKTGEPTNKPKEISEAELKKMEREQKREEAKLRAEYLKTWSKPRDDLECDDLKPFPSWIEYTVPTKLDSETLGLALTIYQFGAAFGDLIDGKAFGLDLSDSTDNLTNDNLKISNPFTWCTFELIEEALLTNQPVYGPLFRLLNCYLLAVLETQYNDEFSNEFLDVPDEILEEVKNQPQIIQQATWDSGLSLVHYGVSLRELVQRDCKPSTITELLHLHFAGAGGYGHPKNVLYRHQQRGAYVSRDDPGLDFKCRRPDVIGSLAGSQSSVFGMTPRDKAEILVTLQTQLLTHVKFRERIETSLDKVKNIRIELKALAHAHAHTASYSSASAKAKASLVEGMEDETERARHDAELYRSKLLELYFTIQRSAISPLGRDRAYRRWWAICLPTCSLSCSPRHTIAIFIENGGDLECNTLHQGVCQDIPTPLTLTPFTRRPWAHTLARVQKLSKFYQANEKNVSNNQEQEMKYLREHGINSKESPLSCVVSSSTSSCQSKQTIMNDLTESAGGFETVQDVCIDVIQYMLSFVTSDTDDNNSHKNAFSFPYSHLHACLGREETFFQSSIDDKCHDVNPYCPVHGYHKIQGYTVIPPHILSIEADFNHLMDCLNDRGYRERALKSALLEFKQLIVVLDQGENFDKVSSNTWIDDRLLSPSFKPEKILTHLKSQNNPSFIETPVSAEEACEVLLQTQLLDLEERIYTNGLGQVAVEERDKWRTALRTGQFSDPIFAQNLIDSDSCLMDNETQNQEAVKSETSALQTLARALVQIAKGIDVRYLLYPLGEHVTEKQERIKALMTNFIARTSPGEHGMEETLIRDSKSVNADTNDLLLLPSITAFSLRWQDELLSAKTPLYSNNNIVNCDLNRDDSGQTTLIMTSFYTVSNLSQISLMALQLDRCINWSASLLKVRCILCKKKNAPEQLLLCDSCNKGYHTYCIRPRIKKIPEGDWYCFNCLNSLTSQSTHRQISSSNLNFITSNDNTPQTNHLETENQQEISLNFDRNHLTPLPNDSTSICSNVVHDMSESQGSQENVLFEISQDEMLDRHTVDEDKMKVTFQSHNNSQSMTRSPSNDLPTTVDFEQNNFSRNVSKKKMANHTKRGRPPNTYLSYNEQDQSITTPEKLANFKKIHRNHNSFTVEKNNDSLDDLTDKQFANHVPNTTTESSPLPLSYLQLYSRSGRQIKRSHRFDDSVDLTNETTIFYSSNNNSVNNIITTPLHITTREDMLNDSNSYILTPSPSRTEKVDIIHRNAENTTHTMAQDGTKSPHHHITSNAKQHKNGNKPKIFVADKNNQYNHLTNGHSSPNSLNIFHSFQDNSPLQTNDHAPKNYPTKENFQQAKFSQSDTLKYATLIMSHIIAKLKKHPDSWPFLEPVNKLQVPDYYDVIKEPMDLLTLESLIPTLCAPYINANQADAAVISSETSSYSLSPFERVLYHFLCKVKLIFTNCQTYNSPYSMIGRTGTKIENYLRNQILSKIDKNPSKEIPTLTFSCSRLLQQSMTHNTLVALYESLASNSTQNDNNVNSNESNIVSNDLCNNMALETQLERSTPQNDNQNI